MKTTRLSNAIKLVLAAQVGATMLASGPETVAQQMPAQPQAVMVQPEFAGNPQGIYAMQQPMVYQQAAPQQVYYAQPQGGYAVQQSPQQQVVYAQPQGANAVQQTVYQQPQQIIYAQPQSVYGAQQPVMYQQQAQQPVYPQPQSAMMQSGVYAQPQTMRPATSMQQVPVYPQGAVLYPQGATMPPQGVQYGNVLVQQAPQMYPVGVAPQGVVVYQQSAGQMQPAPAMMYPNGMPVQQGAAAYGYSGQVPQGAVVYSNGAVIQPAAMSGMTANATAAGATVVIEGASSADGIPASAPRLQTGSLNKFDTRASNRPVQSLSSNDLRGANAVNIESVLNTLPQIIPGRDRSDNNPGTGSATADIRGLGTSRTAVLVNGRPFAPSGGLGVSDLNAIPRALIKQVDVTTGGSSVVHGSGAMAGAVNFVLDENFQGAELNVSHQSTAQQDGALSSVDLTLGSSFANGKGNIAVSVGGSEREAVFQGDRDFSAIALSEVSDVNGDLILAGGGSTGVPGTSIFAGPFFTFSPSFGVTFDPDGNIRPFETGEQNDYYNYAPVNYLQVPQTRRHGTVVANFEIAESLELYGLGMFSETKTTSQLAPTPIFQNNIEFTLDGSPFLTPFSQQVLSDTVGNGIDSDGDGIDDTATTFIRHRLLESGPRRRISDSTSQYVQLGLRGEIGSALEYDIYASRGVTDRLETQEGNVSRARFQQALLLDLQADPTGGVCQQTSSDTTDLSCVPANIFGEGNMSPDAAAFLAAGVAIDSSATQSIYGARLTGVIGSLPGGNARVTVGAERREESFNNQFTLTNLAGQGDQAGFNAGPDVTGETSSESVYGGVYLPLVAGANGAEIVDLELGYRLTDYTTAQGVASYGANGSWAPSEFVRLRAGYNRAHRAPTVSELYTPESEGFPSASDPCSASGSPNGVSPEVAAICIATGVPAELVGTTALNPPNNQVRAVSGGNANLVEEQADTFSVGLEFAVPFGDEGLFSAGADYFQMDGSQGIAAFGGGAANVLNECYGAGGSSADSLSIFCDVVNRAPDGTIDSVELKNQNVAFFEVEGVDLFAGVSLPALGGTVGVNFNGTILNKHRFTAYEGDDPIECAGKFGNLCGEPLPSYSHRVTAGWANDNLAASLIWRHIGAVNDDDEQTVFFREKLNARDYLDAELSVELADSLAVAIGVQNLTDVSVPVLGDNAEQANTYPATYDPYGRTYFVRLTGASSLNNK